MSIGTIAAPVVLGAMMLLASAQAQPAPDSEQPGEVLDQATAALGSGKIVLPVLLHPSECEIHSLRLRKGIEVRPTFVRFTVNAEGKVTDVSVVRSSGLGALDMRGQACAAHQEYAPAQRDGQPVAVTLVRRFTWTSHAN